MFETQVDLLHVAWQGLPCYSAVAQLGFKRHTTVLLKSNLIQSIEFDTAVATFEMGLSVLSIATE